MGFFDYITKIDFSILYYIQEHLRCSFLDFLMPLFGFIQEGGMVWIVISIILICFKKTRYCGFAILLAMGIDTLITEFTLKNIICRVRPCNIDFSIKCLFQDLILMVFHQTIQQVHFAAQLLCLLL